MRIEELADDFDETKITSPFPQDAARNAPSISQDGTPSLPPALEAVRGKTSDEILADLNKMPLFMTELEENDDLEAIRALAYEGTPAEVAQGFKERGNESFQEKKWADAKEFYGKGIEVLQVEEKKRKAGQAPKDGETTSEEKVQNEKSIWEICLVNRAACHLELKNFRSCTQDCAAALRLNPKNVKAYYRSSRALLSLSKILEADDACARGLTIDPKNAPLKAVAAQIIAKNEAIAEKARKETERENKVNKERYIRSAALVARGIRTIKTAQPPEMEDAKIEMIPDPMDPTSTLSFPCVLLYPLHLESDFIKSFNELQSLNDHLSYIFPLPWDMKGEYTPKSVECYMETMTGGLIKVGKKVSLLKTLSEGNVEIIDEVVRIFVVPTVKAAEWVAEFKRKKAAEKGVA